MILYAEVVREFQKRSSLRDVRDRFNISAKLAREILEGKGIDVIEVVVQDTKAGLKQREITAKHGIANRTLSQWLSERGEKVLRGNLRAHVYEADVFDFIESGGNTRHAIMKKFGISAKRAQHFIDEKTSRCR